MMNLTGMPGRRAELRLRVFGDSVQDRMLIARLEGRGPCDEPLELSSSKFSMCH
jgi:hypothetical protein